VLLIDAGTCRGTAKKPNQRPQACFHPVAYPVDNVNATESVRIISIYYCEKVGY